MRKTKDEELLDETKTEKKPATKKKSSTKKTSTTSKSTKNSEKSSDEANSNTTTKKTVSTVSKTKKASSASVKKTSTKTKTEKALEDIEPIDEIVDKPKKKSNSIKKSSAVATSAKKATTKTSSTPKVKKADEKSNTEKSTSTRKKRTTAKPVDIDVEKVENIEKIEKVENEPVYINPDILKFEERLKRLKTTPTTSSISLEQKETQTLKEDIPSKIEEVVEKVPKKEISKKIEKKKITEKSQIDKIEKTIPKEKTISEEKSLKKKKEKTNKKFNANYIYNTIIVICIILILYSVINIILWQKNNIDNSNLIKQVSEITPVTETSSVVINENLQIEKKSYDFTELLNQNPDTVGWIHLNNTDIDYPVVKAQDNDFYLTHAFDKTYNAAGWIYADYRNRCDDTDTNLIIYGHNRLNDNMFGTLENVLSNPWLSDENNHYIHFSSINKSHIYSIFSAFICTSDDSINYLRTGFSSNADFTQYINDLKKLSSYDFNVNLTEDDKIITLYTCHGLNNERLIVCGKLIN